LHIELQPEEEGGRTVRFEKAARARGGLKKGLHATYRRNQGRRNSIVIALRMGTGHAGAGERRGNVQGDVFLDPLVREGRKKIGPLHRPRMGAGFFNGIARKPGDEAS